MIKQSKAFKFSSKSLRDVRRTFPQYLRANEAKMKKTYAKKGRSHKIWHPTTTSVKLRRFAIPQPEMKGTMTPLAERFKPATPRVF